MSSIAGTSFETCCRLSSRKPEGSCCFSVYDSKTRWAYRKRDELRNLLFHQASTHDKTWPHHQVSVILRTVQLSMYDSKTRMRFEICARLQPRGAITKRDSSLYLSLRTVASRELEADIYFLGTGIIRPDRHFTI